MAQQKKKGGFFSGLGKAIDGAAKSVSSDLANVTINPLDHIKHGNVIQITSRMCVKCIAVGSDGVVSCTSNPLQQKLNREAQFEVVASPYSPKAYKFRNAAYPQYYLAIVNGFFIGSGQGGPECDFYIHRTSAGSSIDISEFCSFESAMSAGSHMGVNKTCQFTAPAQTAPHASNAAHFRLRFIQHNELPPVAVGTPPQPTHQGVPSAPQPQGYPPQYAGGPPPPSGPQQQGYPPQYAGAPPPPI